MTDSEHPEDDDRDLQVALVRRAVDRHDADRKGCHGCGRNPLVGERVYLDQRSALYCELCRAIDPGVFVESRIVHGPEFGHTMWLTDRRVA